MKFSLNTYNVIFHSPKKKFKLDKFRLKKKNVMILLKNFLKFPMSYEILKTSYIWPEYQPEKTLTLENLYIK